MYRLALRATIFYGFKKTLLQCKIKLFQIEKLNLFQKHFFKASNEMEAYTSTLSLST